MIDAKTLDYILQDSLQNFAAGHILDGIHSLRMLLPYCTAENIVSVEAESLEENYNHMLSFLRNGGDDANRRHVQEKIQLHGIALTQQACRTIRLHLGDDHYSKALSRLHDIYGAKTQDAIFAKWQSLLTPEETCEVQDDIFDLLWTAPLWTAQDTALWYDFITRQQDMVQQHLAGALFLSAWEYCDTEKIRLLSLLADTKCHRTHIATITYLLLLRLRHKGLAMLMPPLPNELHTRKDRQLAPQVQSEMLLMLLAEEDMKREMEEAETLAKDFATGKQKVNFDSIKAYIELKARYLKRRLERGLDPNLAKVSLLHSCKYLHRIAHWFLPLDKSHPLFQSVMIDEKGREKQHLSLLVDLILDCDVDKLATLYLISTDKDFSGVAHQLDNQELPDAEDLIIQDYSIRYIMQDLYRFFLHSPLSTQTFNPFRSKQTLTDIPELAHLFTTDDRIHTCSLLFETGRDAQALAALDKLIEHKGAAAPMLLLKGQILMYQKRYPEAIASLQSADILQPDNIETLRLLTECYAQQQRFEDELENLQRLSELLPDEATYRRLIPKAMAKAGRNEEALQRFFKLDYETQEDDETILSGIASTAFALSRFDVAWRYTEKELLLSEGKNWSAHLRAGHIKLLQGGWKESIDSYIQFIITYCKETGQEREAALAHFDKEQDTLTAKGIAQEDFLLLRDILQATASGTL